MKKRIEGYDFARALAVFGMVFVNFKIVLGSSFGGASLSAIISLLEGRAAALFVVLAGVGISLMTSSQAGKDIHAGKLALYKRGILLIVFGLLLTLVWPADILHFYGFYFLIASFFINAKDRVLWLFVLLVCVVSTILMIVLDYGVGWDFATLTYLDFWTYEGMFRHIFFNGFHPVLPWIAFIFIGMWLGRKDLRNIRLRRTILVWSGLVWGSVELMSNFLMLVALESVSPDNDSLVLLGTAMMPPFPLYVIAAASLAVFLICISAEVTLFCDRSTIVRWITSTGKLALTIYVAHVFIGMGIMDSLGLIGNQSVEVAFVFALAFCCFSILFSVLWLSRFGVGPIESIFKKLAS